MTEQFKIEDSPEYGVIVAIGDTELADEFDDYLNEEAYAPSQLRMLDDGVEILFGKAATTSKVAELIESFLASR